jgi:hypothetical protein
MLSVFGAVKHLVKFSHVKIDHVIFRKETGVGGSSDSKP